MPGSVTVHAHGRRGVRIAWIVGEQDALQARKHLLEDFQALRAQVEVRIGHAGDIAAGPGEALNEPQRDRIAHDGGEDDGNSVGCQLGRPRRVRVGGEDDIHSGLDQVAGRRRKRGDVSLRETDTDDELLALPIAERLQPVTEADHLGGRAPGLRQGPDLDRARALGRLRAPVVGFEAHQHGEQGQAAWPEGARTPLGEPWSAIVALDPPWPRWRTHATLRANTPSRIATPAPASTTPPRSTCRGLMLPASFVSGALYARPRTQVCGTKRQSSS